MRKLLISRQSALSSSMLSAFTSAEQFTLSRMLKAPYLIKNTRGAKP
jgi:arginine repressor